MRRGKNSSVQSQMQSVSATNLVKVTLPLFAMTSTALIHRDNATPKYQDTDGILIHRGAGLSMAQFIDKGGKVVTKVLNIGYKWTTIP